MGKAGRIDSWDGEWDGGGWRLTGLKNVNRERY